MTDLVWVLNSMLQTVWFSDGLDEIQYIDKWDGWEVNKAATYFEYDDDEIQQENYKFRADVNFHCENTYELKVRTTKLNSWEWLGHLF